MVYLRNIFFVSILASAAYGLPLYKRIAQVISDSTAQWEKACQAAGGGDKCNPISVTAFSTLLAAAGPCEQQNSADSMIDLAKTLNDDPTMIKMAQIFAQQPRNSPTSQSVLYCQNAPKNSELNGLFQCQFQGTDKQTFVGGVKVGAAGTIPFGQTSPLNPAGSCPAHPDGPVPDGTQLVSLTQDPGAGSGSGNASSGNASTPTAPTTTSAAPAASSSPAEPEDDCDDSSDTQDDPASTPSITTAASPAATSPPSTNASSFLLQNGKDAQGLNAKFATLTADSTCNDGETACVEGSFAQCVGSKFVLSQCTGGTTCVALPLVNKAGTSIACDTEADAAARISASGAQGGLTGN